MRIPASAMKEEEEEEEEEGEEVEAPFLVCRRAVW